MKINLIPTNKLAMLSAAFCAVVLAFSQNASALTFGDANDLGQVLFGIPSGDVARTNYVNHLIQMAPGTSDSFLNQTFNRSLANPAPGFPNYEPAAFGLNGTGTTIDLGTAGTYCYLFAKYDGPNAGSEVWYVGSLSGVITIPADGLAADVNAGHGYGLSGWTLFTCANHVPDGGTTVMLLGTAFGVLGIARRYIMS